MVKHPPRSGEVEGSSRAGAWLKGICARAI